MINLMPSEIKHDIRAARMNVILLRYLLTMIGAVILLALFCLTFFVILRSTQSNAVSTNKDNAAKATSYQSVRNQADAYRNDLRIAKQIFANSISYTDIINRITELVPKGVVLDSISLTSNTFGSQTAFSAHAKSYGAATTLKENFECADEQLQKQFGCANLFSNIYFQNLTESGGDKTAGDDGTSYPVSVVLSAKLNKEVGQQ